MYVRVVSIVRQRWGRSLGEIVTEIKISILKNKTVSTKNADEITNPKDCIFVFPIYFINTKRTKNV